MGMRFSLECANLVAYITAPRCGREPEAPRAPLSTMETFFRSIAYEEAVWSREHDWIGQIRGLAERNLYEDLPSVANSLREDSNGYLDSAEVRKLLQPFREAFREFSLYALAVSGAKSHGETVAFIRMAGYESRINGVFMVPDMPSEAPQIVLDPFPGISEIARAPNRIPGVLFWTQIGQPKFLSLKRAREFFSSLQNSAEAFSNRGEVISQIADMLERFEARDVSRRIVHLSDLHLGNNIGGHGKRYLLEHITNEHLKGVARVVVTGDVIDSPNKAGFELYTDFIYGLRKLSPDPIVIPGNHDQRWRGNALAGLGMERALVEEMLMQRIVVDDRMKVIFLCFDSSSAVANFARGRVDELQLQAMARQLQDALSQRHELRGYKLIALIHHHPFSFEAAAESGLQKLFRRVGISDEKFIKMDRGDEFVQWCAQIGVNLILHGHKHVPRHVQRDIVVRSHAKTKNMALTAIGCGSSLGAENMRLSYDVLTFNSATSNWSVQFFSCDRALSGFHEDVVAVTAS